MAEKSPIDNDLKLFSEDWKNQPVAHIDGVNLLKKIKRRIFISKCLLAANIIFTLICFAAFIASFTIYNWSLPVKLYLGFGTMVSTIFIYFEYKIRKNTWHLENQNPGKVIDNSLATNQSSIKYIQLNFLCLLIFFPVGNWFIYALQERRGEQAILPYTLLNGIMFFFLVICLWCYRNRISERERLENLK